MPSGRVELGRQTCYDNITVGTNQTTKERTISGSAPPAKIVGGGEGSTGANAKGHSNIALASDYPTANIPDDIARAAITPVLENVKAGG